MIKNPIELLMRRRNVQAFVEADALEAVLTRREKISTPAGGWTWGPTTTTAPQWVRIVPSKRRYADITVNTEAGAIPTWPYLMLGEPDMDVAVGDTFRWQGDLYQVKSIEPDREERTVAAIDHYKA